MSDHAQPSHPPGRAWLWAGLAGGLAYFCLSLAIISTNIITERAGFDDIMNHEPTIREFARQWPHFDFTDYLSATTPGYHLLLAGVVRYISADRHVLQVVGSLFGAALIGLMVAMAARSAGALRGVILVLPLAMSAYVLQSATYLLPDDIAWLLLLIALALCLRPWSVPRALAIGLVTLLAVFVRQPLLWLAGLAWMAAWLSVGETRHLRALILDHPAARLGRTGVAILATLPAFAIIAYFASIWHGLTVPRYQHFHEGFGRSTVVFVLANIGFSSLFFGASLWPILVQLWRRAKALLVIMLLCCAAVGVLQPSTFDEAEGRFSGLWTIGQKLPHVGHVSLFMFALTLAGGVGLLGWLVTFDTRRRLILLAALVGFTAAQSMNKLTAQRYVEPFVMMLVILAAARAVSYCPPRRRRTLIIGPLCYAAYCIAVNVHTYQGWMFVKDYPRDAAQVEGGPYIRPEDRPKPPAPPLPKP